MPNIGKLYIKQANTFSFYYLSLRKVYNSRGWPYMSNIKTIQGYCIEFTCLKGRKVDPQILLTIISLVSNMKKINSNFAKLFVFILRKREHVSNLYVYLFRSINYECMGLAAQCPPPPHKIGLRYLHHNFGMSVQHSSQSVFRRSPKTFLIEGVLGSKKNYLAKVCRSAQNLGVGIFPDPVSHFGAPWRPFWILQAVSECPIRC